MKRYLKKIVTSLFCSQKASTQISEYNHFKTESYSQEGEDLILARYFGAKEEGFYIDIGAHHPYRFSNTFLFYQRGWSGLNVDANPGVKELFDRYRARDTNIEIGVSGSESDLVYYRFRESALNTFSSELANIYIEDSWELIEKKVIHTISLSQLLEKWLPAGVKIDFLSLDIEGFELEALKSNDWIKYRPRIILVEILDFDLGAYKDHPLCSFLLERGYALTAKTKNTIFFENILQA